MNVTTGILDASAFSGEFHEIKVAERSSDGFTTPAGMRPWRAAGIRTNAW